MPTERNRYDLPREYDYYRDQIQRVRRAQERIAYSRDDEEIYRLNEDRRQQSPFLRDTAQAVLIGSLAALAGRKFIGTDVGRRIVGSLTAIADTVRNRTIQASYITAAEYLRATGYKNTRVVDALIRGSREDLPRIQHLDIATAVQDMARVYETVRDPKNNRINQNLLQQMVDINKQRITERFAAGSRSIGEIQDLTVGNIMDMAESTRKEIFSDNVFQSLKYGLDKGFLKRDLQVGGGLFWDIAKSPDFSTNALIHVPTGRQVGTAIRTIANQINIPFTGIKFGDIVAPPIERLFAKGPYAAVGRSPFSKAPVVNIGGELFSVGNEKRLTSLGTGYTTLHAGTMAESHAARMGMLDIQSESQYTGKLLDEYFTSRHPVKSFFMSLSELVGIGPQYRTQNAIPKKLFWDIPKTRLYGEPHIKQTMAPRKQGFSGRLANQLSRNLDIDPQTGRKLSTLPFEAQLFRQDPRIKLPTTYDDLGPIDKVKALFGSKDKAVFLDPTAKSVLGQPITKQVVAQPPGRGTLNYGSRKVFPGEEFVDQLGQPKQTAPLQHIFVQEGKTEALYDIAHYMTNRLNNLIGATAGIGFRPTQGNISGVVGNLAKIYGIYKGFEYGVEGLKYLDYLLSVNGYSPSDLALDTYKAGRISLQYAREFTGLSPAARYLENLMPGSVDGLIPSAVRTLGPAAIGLYKKSLPGTMLGLAAGLFMGPGISETPKDTADILSGEKLVPIRKGRYWWLGKQPFEGGKVDYFAPGIVARLRSDYKYTDTLYGTEAEYFRKTSPLPTPTNLFGLLRDEDYLANKHQLDRPYPKTDSEGYALGRTLPEDRRSLYGAYGPPATAASALGFGQIQPNLKKYNELGQNKLANALSQISELGGIYKFGLWNLTGAEDLYGDTQALATADFMSSPARSFFDEQMGGMFGMSELYRRFVTSDEVRRQRYGLNPIVNTMPEWLPGSRSLFTGKGKYGSIPGDVNYHIDFTLGDPYAKLKHGEFRLPGEARERLFRLHSGSPGIYDAVDRFMILADVAPYSDAFKHYKTIVESWRKSGVLDDYWSDKIETTQEQVKQKMERYQIYYRRFTGLQLPFKMVEPPEYSLAERTIGGAWETLTHDIVPRVGISVPLLGPLLSNKLLAQRDPIEQYLKTEIYDTDDYDWSRPWPTIVRPMFEQLKATDPFTALIGGGITGYAFGANPLAKLMLGAAGSMFFGANSAARVVNTGQLTGGYVPEYVQDRRELQEYFDQLNYVKYRKLENQAKSVGDMSLAKYFTEAKERTVASLDYSLPAWEFNQAAMRALPSRERSFFQDFVNAPIEQRKDIYQYLPEYLKPVYQAAWAKSGDKRFSYSSVQRSPDQRTAEYFSEHGLPSSDWIGWHPDVNPRFVQIKTMDAMGNSIAEDFHRMNLYSFDRFQANRQFPGDQLDVSAMFFSRPGFRQDIQQIFQSELLLNGVSDVKIDNDLSGGLENSITWDIQEDKRPSFFAQADAVLRGLAS